MDQAPEHVIEGVAERLQDARPSAAAADQGADGLAQRTMRQAAGWQQRVSTGEPLNRARAMVHMQPLAALASAGVLGLALGWLLGRRRR